VHVEIDFSSLNDYDDYYDAWPEPDSELGAKWAELAEPAFTEELWRRTE
jgi:hypothetical protein